MARYIFQITGEAVVEADSLVAAKRKSKEQENYIEVSWYPTSTPIPEDLLYSMDLINEEEQ